MHPAATLSADRLQGSPRSILQTPSAKLRWERRSYSRSLGGRERCLRFIGGRKEIREKALPFLRSPVSKRIFIRRIAGVQGAARAGLTALAHFSMLESPEYTTYALSREDWKALRHKHKIIEVPAQDEDASEVEIWWYPPALFAEDGFVDRLSLFLALKDERDERTETALEEMMEKLKW